jgi:ABC-type uncharacterized transport system permease subunit
MDTLVANAAAIAMYLTASVFVVVQIVRQARGAITWVLSLAACAIAFHAIGIHGLIFTPQGFQFSFYIALAFIFLTVNTLVLVSSLKKPLHNLFVLLFPISAIALICAIMIPPTAAPLTNIGTDISFHILLSVLAYSLLTIATLQALVLAYQNRQLHNKQLTGVVRMLPPLQTMEQLLFELLWAGMILLTLGILTGFLFFDDLFAQHLVHKSAFSILAWFIYGTLLWGRHRQGWRGNTAIRWTLGGFAALMLAYFGSKLVLELILGGV